MPDSIQEGSRNATLTSLAGSMRHRGMSEKAMRVALLAQNSESCVPPLEEDEVESIARSVACYAPGSEEAVGSETVEEVLERAGLGSDVQLEKSTAQDLEVALRNLKTEVTSLDPIGRVVLRETLIQRLKKADVSGPTQMIDAALSEAQQDQGDKHQGRAVVFEGWSPGLSQLMVMHYLPRSRSWFHSMLLPATWFRLPLRRLPCSPTHLTVLKSVQS